MFITYFFLMSLFTLTLLRQFEEFYINFNSPLQKYKDNLNNFKKIWSFVSEFDERSKIKCSNLLSFFKLLGSPLGYNQSESIENTYKKIMLMNIPK